MVFSISKYSQGMLIIDMNTGMRLGEPRCLQLGYISLKAGFIQLPAYFTKEQREKVIPINHHVKAAFEGLMRHLHHDFHLRPGIDRRPWSLQGRAEGILQEGWDSIRTQGGKSDHHVRCSAHGENQHA